jgi:hypothetical protein
MPRPKRPTKVPLIYAMFSLIDRTVIRDVKSGIARLLQFANASGPDPVQQRVRDRLFEIGPEMRCRKCGHKQRTDATRCDERTCGGRLTRVGFSAPPIVPAQRVYVSAPIAGYPYEAPPLPDWITVAEQNLVALVRDGGWYLRRCTACDAFFVCQHARQLVCSTTPQCRLDARAARARRDRKALRDQRDRDKAALHARDVRRKNARA